MQMESRLHAKTKGFSQGEVMKMPRTITAMIKLAYRRVLLITASEAPANVKCLVSCRLVSALD